MRTDTMTLASALDTLAKTTKTDDGVFNAAIAEAAQRLREQEWELRGLGPKVCVREFLRDTHAGGIQT